VTTRVIQWATGAVGSVQLQQVIDRSDLELVGVYVYTPDKVGQDAGALVGRSPAGVLATNDKDAILALDADLVLHAASKAHPRNTNSQDIVALLESGKDVITTSSYNHLPTFDLKVAEQVAAACRRTGARFHAAGEHPSPTTPVGTSPSTATSSCASSSKAHPHCAWSSESATVTPKASPALPVASSRSR
jgi:2,4-diaminopentanoate dehydrogenase